MGAMAIVIVASGRDQLPGVTQVGKQVLVGALGAQATIEAFNEAVMHWFSGRDVVPFDLSFFLPFQDGIRRQFGGDCPEFCALAW